jgi:Zn-dependent protease
MDIFFAIAVLIFSVVIHEVAHGYVANELGDPTARMKGRLTLNPIKHLDLVGSFIVPVLMWFTGGFIFGWAKPVPVNPYNLSYKYGHAIVAGAGPAVNMSVAVLFGLVMRFAPLPSGITTILGFIVFINIILAVFNLIPIPPLDGSKILFTALPYKYNYIKENLRQYGFLILIIFILFLWQLLVPIMTGLFKLLTGTAPVF